MIKNLRQLVCLFSVAVILSVSASSFCLMGNCVTSEGIRENFRMSDQSKKLADSFEDNINKMAYASLDRQIDTSEVLQAGLADNLLDDVVDSFKNKIDNQVNNQNNNRINKYGTGSIISISQAEYNLICSVVMRETGYGSYEGCVAVSQCFRNAMIREKNSGNAYDAWSVQRKYGYGGVGRTPNERVKRAVYDVFYNGVTITSEPIICYYAPALAYSAWHESQIYVCSYDGNKFFKFR